MKYFIKYKQGRPSSSNIINYEDSTMFITCDDIEKAWYEHKIESDFEQILVDITPLPTT